MEARIAYINEKGGVSVIIPAPEWLAQKDAEGKLVNKVEDLVPEGGVIIAASTLPVLAENLPQRQRSYRDAWRLVDGKVVVDMPTAKQIHLGRIRREREPKLAALDAQFARAERNGEDNGDLHAQRADLLNCTEEVKNTTYHDPKDLYAAWPAVLEKRKPAQ